MKIDQVKQIANLARIKFSDDELKVLAKELSCIFDYFDQLKEVDIKGVDPFVHAVDLCNVTRVDEAIKTDINLIDLAPDKKKDHVKTKPIFDD